MDMQIIPFPNRRPSRRPTRKDCTFLHSALGSVSSFKHGEVEYSSGIYAILNGFRLALAPYHGLAARKAWIAYGHTVDHWQTKEHLLESLIRGIGFATVTKTARRLAWWLSDDHVTLSVEKLPGKAGRSSADQFAWIEASLAQNCPVIIRLSHGARRYSVIGGLDPLGVHLFDSGDLKLIRHKNIKLDKMFRIRATLSRNAGEMGLPTPPNPKIETTGRLRRRYAMASPPRPQQFGKGSRP
jgi:hypothetical protein